jgi:formate dehydrogenase major subunit
MTATSFASWVGYGSATLPVRLSTAIQPGHLFATFHTSEVFLNALAGPHRDETTGTPEYKVTAVFIEHHESPCVRDFPCE